MTSSTLDMVTISRSSVEPYGQQIGKRLEDVDRFSKVVGRSPTKTAFDAARLGLKTGLAILPTMIRP